MRSSFERYCHLFEDVVGLADAVIAQRINSAGVRLLVDLNGYTHGARSGVTAMRPAPITVFDQVCDTGVDVVSYRDCDSQGVCWDIRRACVAFEQRPHQHERGDG